MFLSSIQIAHIGHVELIGVIFRENCLHGVNTITLSNSAFGEVYPNVSIAVEKESESVLENTTSVIGQWMGKIQGTNRAFVVLI